MFHFWSNAVIRGFKLFTSFIAVILPTFYDKKTMKIKTLLAPNKIT